jgi:hypothetical protein
LIDAPRRYNDVPGSFIDSRQLLQGGDQLFRQWSRRIGIRAGDEAAIDDDVSCQLDVDEYSAPSALSASSSS